MSFGATYSPPGYGGYDSPINYGIGTGAGLGSAKPVEDPKVGQQYISGGLGYIPPKIPLCLGWMTDSVEVDYGWDVYDAMMRSDPIISGHIRGLVMGAIAGDIELMSAVRPKPNLANKLLEPLKTGNAKPVPKKEADADSSEGGSKSATSASASDSPPAAPAPAKPASGATPAAPNEPPTVPEAPRDPEEVEAEKYRDFQIRMLSRCETSIEQLLRTLVEGALVGGHKLAEKVKEIVPSGEDKGKFYWADIKVRPRWAWRFVVNTYMDRLGILTYDPTTFQFVVIPDSSCVVFTWLPRDNDPRGQSQLRPIVRFWNMKQMLMPEYFDFLLQFAGPCITAETAPDEPERPNEDDLGNPIIGGRNDPVQPEGTESDGDLPQPLPSGSPPPLTVSPQVYARRALEGIRSGSVYVGPNGSKVNFNWPKGRGETFTDAFAWLDRQEAFGIMYSTRATMESQHGSKADSQTSQDQVGLLIDFIKDLLSRLVEDQILYPNMLENFGEEIADKYTAKVMVGKTEHQDFSSRMHAVAAGVTAGYFGMNQLASGALDTWLGLPRRDADDVPMFLMPKATPATNASTSPQVGADGQAAEDPNKPAPAKKAAA